MWSRSVAALTVTLMLASGCGSTPVDGAAVGWADRVCGALSGFAQAAAARPKIDPANPRATVRGLDGYLGSTSSALQTALTGLDAAGPAPVPGGDAYVSRLKDTLGQVRTGFDGARTRLADVDTSDPDAVTAALPTALAPLQRLSALADPTQGLEATGELRAAAEQAPNCRRIGTG